MIPASKRAFSNEPWAWGVCRAGMNFLQNSEKILGREEWLRQMGEDEMRPTLLRLKPGLRYHLRAEFAQKALKLFDHIFRLRSLEVEFEDAAGREL
jgi:hypothetical protein